jgi:glycosyltransferase involved in cell wall biosynthesis
MRVTVIPTITAYPWGAPGHCMGALVEELLEAGHEVQWFVAPIDLAHAEVARLQSLGATVRRLPNSPKGYVRAAGIRRTFDRLFGGAEVLSEQVRDFRPNHIFVNDGGTWSGVDVPLHELLQSHRRRYSIISHLNHPQTPFCPQRLERARKLATNASRYFFNSKWSKELAEEQIALPIRNAAFYQLPLRHKAGDALPWPDSPEVARLGFVTRLDAYHKGLDIAVAAVARLKELGTKARLTIAGGGPDEAYLLELISFCGVEECVERRPYTTDVEGFWRDQELCLLPSRYEGLGVGMLEAMSFGRPVLRTPYGGCEEWIEDRVNGFVCPAAEVSLLVETLQRALADRNRWREMGLAAHAKIKRDLDPRPGRVFLEALETQDAN